jgi:anti-sigma factor RsiW
MNCENNEVNDQLLDLAAGSEATAEQAAHLAACSSCAMKLTELRSTMALLDTWQAPEPSAYFDSRLRARMREEREAAPRGFFGWFKSPSILRPIAAAAFVLVLAAGIGVYNLTGGPGAVATPTQTQNMAAQKAPEGSAVADLQTLDKNADVLANFDLLDDLGANQQAAGAQQ